MSTNFLGLGFSFGAEDTGLDSTLSGVTTQFKTLTDSIAEFQSAAAEVASTDSLTKGIEDAVSSADLDVGFDLGESLDVEAATSAAAKGVDDVADSLDGMASEAALGGTGFGRMANHVLGGAGKITGALGWVGMAIGPVISGFGQAAESAGAMIDAVTGLPRRAGDVINRIANQGINLTHSLEAEALGLGVTARAVGANMGYVGQELNRFTGRATGMAMGLNIGADEAARALRAVDEAGSELAAMNLGNARDVARFQAAFGVNADILRNAGLSMRNELGMGDEVIGQITSSMTAMGQQTGDVAGAINQINDLMALLRRRRALGDTPEQLQQFASDTAAAARGMFEFTQDSDLVRQTSAQLAEQLTENRESFRNMFAGAEAEFPQLMTEISIVSGGVGQAFDSMTQGPGQFMEAMGQIVDRVRQQGGDVTGFLDRVMRGRLQQIFGADQTALMVNFWSNMTDETTSAMQAVRGAEVDLGDLARQAHRTGRTMDEVFERMRGFFQVAMRRFARQDSRDFLRNTRASLRDLRVAADEAHRSQGPLSDVMGLLSRSQQLGALALMPAELRGSAVAADELRGQIMPLVQAFSSWGGIFDTVLGYASVFATSVISDWGRITRASREGGGETIDSMEALGQAIDNQAKRYAGIFITTIGEIETWVTRVASAFADLNFDQLFEVSEGDEATGVMGAIRRVFDRLGDVDWSGIWKNIQTGLNNLFEHVRPWVEQKMDQIREGIWDRIGDWWEAIDWRAVFSSGDDLAGGLWGVFEPALSVLGDMIGQWFSDHWLDIIMYGAVALVAALALLVAGVVVGFVASIIAPWIYTFTLISLAWERWGDDIIQFFGGLVDGVQEIWTYLWNDIVLDYLRDTADALEEIWDYLWNDVILDYIRDTTDSLEEIWTYLWEDVFMDAVRDAGNWFRSAWNQISGWFSNLWTQMGDNVTQAIEDWRTIFSAIGEFFTGLGQGIRDTVGGAVAWISEQWDSFVVGLQEVWATLGTGWDDFLSSAEEVWDNLMGVPDRLRTAWDGIVGFFRTIFTSLRAVVGEDLQAVGQIFTSMSDVATRALNAIMGTAEENHGNSVHTLIEEDLAQAVTYIEEMATTVSDTITAVLHDSLIAAIVDAFATGFATVAENMDEFAEGMIGQFQTMAAGISEIMTNLFVAVLDQSEQALLGTEAAVSGITARLRTITEAQERVAEARERSVSALARPADDEAMQRRLTQLQGNEVLYAINHPDWYSGVAGQGGYRRLFMDKMNELRDAIAAIGVAPVPGGTAEARRRIEGNREAVRRSRIGGQPGLPGGPGR